MGLAKYIPTIRRTDESTEPAEYDMDIDEGDECTVYFEPNDVDQKLECSECGETVVCIMNHEGGGIRAMERIECGCDDVHDWAFGIEVEETDD